MGSLLESFVVQQIVAQASWTDPDLRVWHYRDKDKVEVDVVITRGRLTWGMEVKASMSFRRADAKGLRRLADRCGDDFRGGVLFYDGRHAASLCPRRNILAVPLAALWERTTDDVEFAGET